MLYIAATSTVVSAAIVVEKEEKRHVYKVQCRYTMLAKF
jgi:hypothetical protein